MPLGAFVANYDHPLNETQHAAYLEGQTLDVSEEVAKAAGARFEPCSADVADDPADEAGPA